MNVEKYLPLLSAWRRPRKVLRICEDCQHEISDTDPLEHRCPAKP